MKNRLNIDKTAIFLAQQPYMDYFMAKNAAKAQNYGMWDKIASAIVVLWMVFIVNV